MRIHRHQFLDGLSHREDDFNFVTTNPEHLVIQSRNHGDFEIIEMYLSRAIVAEFIANMQEYLYEGLPRVEQMPISSGLSAELDRANDVVRTTVRSTFDPTQGYSVPSSPPPIQYTISPGTSIDMAQVQTIMAGVSVGAATTDF